MSRSLRLAWCWFWAADSWSFAESGLNLQEVYETSRGEDFTEAVGAWNHGLGFGWWSLSGRGYAPQRGPEGGLAGGGTLFTEIGADESGLALNIVEIAEPVEGVGFFDDDEILHGEHDEVAFSEFGGARLPGEGAAIDLAVTGAGESAIDFCSQGGDVGLHAAGVVKYDAEVAAADMDAADLSFFDIAIFGFGQFWVEAESNKEFVTGGDDFGEEGGDVAIFTLGEGCFEAFAGEISKEGDLDF